MREPPQAAQEALDRFSFQAAVIIGAPDPATWAKFTRQLARDWVEANPPTEFELARWRGVFGRKDSEECRWEGEGGALTPSWEAE